MSEPPTLDETTIDAIAQRVVELLDRDPDHHVEVSRRRESLGSLLDAAEVAARFNVSRDYVYGHADELGAIRLGDGPKARLRFDPVIVAGALVPPPLKHEPEPRRPRPRPHKPAANLLPIKGARCPP